MANKSKVEGLNKVLSMFDSVPKDIEEDVIQLISKTAYQIEADAKIFAPVDTGNLRNSIKTTISEGGKHAVVGTDVEYSEFVEFGTFKQLAQPFLGPAYIKNKLKFEQEMQKIVDKGGG